ncbi:MAG: flagellar hook-associated protein FlgK [Rhodospirillales bacterium]|nr:flagellar hook-associated protein FlgK [Rhodospirillales bacterium]
MSGSLSTALQTSISGLSANERALNTIANNISNVNTKGYTRRTVEQEQRVLNGIGAGVQITEITRRVDETLLRNLRLEHARFGAIDVQQNYYDRTQELFGAPGDDNAIGHTIAKFAGAIESLAMQPQNSLEQRDVVRWAEQTASQLRRMSETVQDLRLQADREIEAAVDEVNTLISRIADLNDDIVRNGAVRRDTSDYEDQRDVALDRLSQIIDIRTFNHSDGDVVVFTSSGQVLVDTVPTSLTHNAVSNVGATTTYSEGDIGGITIGAAVNANDITRSIRGGELKGLIDMRDAVLPNMQSELDALAAALRDTVNQVHNRGLAFPGMQDMSGSRSFVTPATQTITFSGDGDTSMVLLDAGGKQVRTDTLRTLLGGAGGSIDDVANAIAAFLGADGSAGVVDGKLVVEVSNPSRYLSFRDEAGTAAGSAPQDAVIRFDADGDGAADETVSGFSNFFGLNDLFVDGLPENIHDSNVLNGTFAATPATLTFRNAGGALGSVAIPAGARLSDIVTAVNKAGIGVTASLVTEGAGARLRFASDDSATISVTDGAADTLLADIGLRVADVRTAASLGVRDDIRQMPSLVARGIVQWDANRGVGGEYHASIGDDTLIQDLAAKLSESRTFAPAGAFAATQASFTQYAGTILAQNAALGASNADDADYARTLLDSIEHKLDSDRGVNLDEEMAQLVIYEQAYAASARVMGTIKSMFETLDRILG